MPITKGHAHQTPSHACHKSLLHLHRWIDLSAKDLVLGMLDSDPKKRLTAKQVINSSHFATHGIPGHMCLQFLSPRRFTAQGHNCPYQNPASHLAANLRGPLPATSW